MNLKEKTEKSTSLVEHKITMKKLKKQVKGITLIALVVTIIVLLILAGIALNLTIGQNGIFSRAEKAANTWRNAGTNEQLALGELGNWIGNYLDENGNGGSQGGGSGDDQTGTTVVDGVPIPNGFYYVGGKKDTGLVISDDPTDENKYSPENWENQDNIPAGKETDEKGAIVGNQFVWVPVEDYSKFQRYDGYWNIGDGTTLQGLISQCQEPASNAVDWETKEHTAMQTSVKNNKGFYVARYEASQGTGNKAESKPDITPWVSIPWGTSMTEVGNSGAVYQAQNMYNDDEHAVTSTLIYGVQWDAIMNWIDSNYSNEKGDCNSFVSDSTDQGWYNQNSATNCGYYQVNNIYDLAGNVFEWTMEAISTESRVVRGGFYGYSGSFVPASARVDNPPDVGDAYFGFRVALYL